MLGGLSPPLPLQDTLKAPPFLQHWYRVCLELGAKMKAHCGWAGLWSQLAAHAGGEESTLELSEPWPSEKLVLGKYLKHHCLGASFLQAPVPTALCEASRCILASPRWCTQGALTTDLLTKFLKEKLTSAGEFTREVRQDGSSRQRAWLAQCSSEAGCQSSQVSRWSTGPENQSSE